MNGKTRPTAKLESQWTLPPTMKAAGREVCRKISVMSRAGMGPGRKEGQLSSLARSQTPGDLHLQLPGPRHHEEPPL